MYPFERFTQKAKQALVFAQQEAEKSHHSFIGSEHILLGLMREPACQAAKVLANLGLQIDGVRAAIEAVLGGDERIFVQQILPTSRVKKVIEIAFEEAKRMNNTYVGTEHLLLGLLIEGEGIAAHVLEESGASLERVREGLATLPPDPDASTQWQQAPHGRLRNPPRWTGYMPRQGATGPPAPDPQARTERLTPEATSCLVLAEEEGVKAGLGYIGGEHLLVGLLRQGEGRAAIALRLLGVTTERAREAAKSAELVAPRQLVAQITWNSDLSIVLGVATDLARQRRVEWIDTEDLLQALWRLPSSSRAHRVLFSLGLTAETVRDALARLDRDGG